VSQLNAAVDINDMVGQHILPELAGNVNKLPVIRADCVKFLATFRNQLPLEVMRTVMPLVINHLAAESPVVQSYAANCIERMLTVKDNGVPRFGRAELQPLLQTLFQNLFVILSRTV
jgi:exportin-2 (importin alpha re-exporter)